MIMIVMTTETATASVRPRPFRQARTISRAAFDQSTAASLFVFVLFIVFFVSSFASTARAEGCDAGYRPPTAAEKTFFEKVRGLLAALPPPPEGWRIKEDDDGSESAAQICKDGDADLAAGTSMLLIGVSRTYERADMEAREQKLAAAAEKAQAWTPSPAEQKTIDDDGAKAQAAMQKMTEAIQHGDAAAQKKYLDEYRHYSQDASTLQMKATTELGKLQQELARDTRAVITVSVNDAYWDSNYERPTRIDFPAAAGAWRETWADDTGGSDVATPHAWTTLLFGPWTDTRSGDDPYLRLRASIPKIPGGAKIATLHVKIEAEPATADALLAKLDGAALKAAALPPSSR
jgi:hypothetical protein